MTPILPIRTGWDPHPAESWIERVRAQAPDCGALLLLGRCRFAELERWQTLSELMGFS